MSSTSASICDGKKMGVQSKAGLRQQLKAKVSGSLSARGVSMADRWSTRPKAKLTKEEQDRLERQRYNKRKWAQKERARCKKELEELKDKGADLELRNEGLKKAVEDLRSYEVRLKSSLVDHQCSFKSHPPSLLKVVYVPSTKKWTDVKNGETISIVVGEDGILRHAERSASARQTHRLRLTSEGEEETAATALPASEFKQIEGTNIVINNGKYYQLNPLPQPVLSTPKPSMSYSGKVGLSGGQVFGAGVSSVNGLLELQSGEVQLYAEPREKRVGQTLSSGGFSLDGMSCGGRSFMEMLQEDDKGEEREGEEEVMILEDTLRIKMEPPDVMQEVEIGSSGMEAEDTPYSQGIMLHDTAGPALSSASGIIPSSFSEGSQSDDSQTRPDASCNGYGIASEESDSGGYSDAAALKKTGKKRSASNRWAADGETEEGGKHSNISFSRKGKKTVVDPWAVAPVSEPDQAGRWRPSESAMAEFHASTEGSFNGADQIFTNTSATASSDAASPARFTTLTNMEIPSTTIVNISDSVTLSDSTLTLDDLSSCEIVEVTVKTETNAEFKHPGSPRRPPLTRLTSWPGLPETPSPARRTRHTSFPAAGFGNVGSKAGQDGDTDDDDIVENAIAAAREAESRSKTSGAVFQADASVTFATSDGAGRAQPDRSRSVSTTSSSALVAAEEIPRSPTSPTSPAPTSPFRARVAIESARRAERDGGQQLMIVEDGGEQRLVLQSLGSTATQSWEFMCEVPASTCQVAE